MATHDLKLPAPWPYCVYAKDVPNGKLRYGVIGPDLHTNAIYDYDDAHNVAMLYHECRDLGMSDDARPNNQ